VPDLRFQVEDAIATPNAATPQISFKVRITNSQPDAVQSVALRIQVQIEPVRRRYTAGEQEHLKELFGESEQWSKSLHPLLWANLNVNVPGFTGNTLIDVAVPCTFDFNVAVTKYIYRLENGELPSSLLFSGTIFYAAASGLQIAQIPWDREASHRLPLRVWQEMMDLYYPETAWLCVRREMFERLHEFKAQHGLLTWEQVLDRLLGCTAEVKS
jgi:hypothetical protein